MSANGSNIDKEAFKFFKKELAVLKEFFTMLFGQYIKEKRPEQETEKIKELVNSLKELESKCPANASEEEFYKTLTEEEKNILNEARVMMGTPILVPVQHVDQFKMLAAANGIATEAMVFDNNEAFQAKMLDKYPSLTPETLRENVYRAVYCLDADKERMADLIDRVNSDGGVFSNQLISSLERKSNIAENRKKDGYGKLSQKFFDKMHPVAEKGERVTIGDEINKEGGLSDVEVSLLDAKCKEKKIPFYATKLSTGRYKITTLKSQLPIMEAYVQQAMIDASGILGQATALTEKERKVQKSNVINAIKDKKPCFIVNRDRSECIEIKANGTALFYCIDSNLKPIMPVKDEVKIGSTYQNEVDAINKIEGWTSKLDLANFAVLTPEEFHSSPTAFDKTFNEKNKAITLAIHELEVVNTVFDEEKIHSKLNKFFDKLYTEKNFAVLPERLKYLVGLALRSSIYKGLANDYDSLSSVIKTINEYEDGHPFKFEIPSREQAADYARHANQQLDEALETFINDPDLGNGNTEIVDDLRTLFNNKNINTNSRTLFVAAQAISTSCDRANNMRIEINGKDLNEITRHIEHTRDEKDKTRTSEEPVI